MLRNTIVAAAVAIVLAGGAGATTFPAETPFDQAAFTAARQAGKPVMVHITTDWCSICAVQKRILDTLLREERFKPLVVYNIDFDHQKDLVRQFRASAQSTMIVFKGDIEEGRMSGDTREKAIALLLSKAFPKPAT